MDRRGEPPDAGADAVDAVVVGSGPNGLVAANLLADAGWSVVVLERNTVPGGAVRSATVTAPGFVNDLYSAFYPLAAASPVIAALALERHGLQWSRAPLVLAHPTGNGPTAVLSQQPEATVASFARFPRASAGDAAAWADLTGRWERLRAPLLDALFTPFPPVRAGARLAVAAVGVGVGESARLGFASVRGLATGRFRGAGPALLLAGNALHTDLTPESAGSALYGWLLAMLGQDVGFPVPVGGAQALTDALVDRLWSRGGVVLTGHEVVRIVVEHGAAIGVEARHDGATVPMRARRAVLADVGAPALYRRLLDPVVVPSRVYAALSRFRYDAATVKVDWALDGTIPWDSGEARLAGTVHVGDSLDDLSTYAAQLAAGHVPAHPFLVVGQMTTSDPTRSPAGTESAWAYTHVPQRILGDAGPDGLCSVDGADAERFADRMERRIERLAPGFRDRIVARHVAGPADLEAANPNLVGGAVNGGTARLDQQLVLRPIPGLGRAETPIRGLFLASASAHPGGGVHGAAGANAARAALAHDRWRQTGVVVAGARRRGGH